VCQAAKDNKRALEELGGVKGLLEKLEVRSG